MSLLGVWLAEVCDRCSFGAIPVNLGCLGVVGLFVYLV